MGAKNILPLNLIAFPSRGRCPVGADRAQAACKRAGRSVSSTSFMKAPYPPFRAVFYKGRCLKAEFKSPVPNYSSLLSNLWWRLRLQFTLGAKHRTASAFPSRGKMPEGRIGRWRYANHGLKSVPAFAQVCGKRLPADDKDFSLRSK